MTDCVVVKLLFINLVLYDLAAPCTELCPKFTNRLRLGGYSLVQIFDYTFHCDINYKDFYK